jgi:hypothetical protein
MRPAGSEDNGVHTSDTSQLNQTKLVENRTPVAPPVMHFQSARAHCRHGSRATHRYSQGLAVRLSFNLVIDVYNFRAISD